MRKYYKPRNVRKRHSGQKLKTPVSPFELLRTYVESSAGFYTFDELCDLISCINRKSVQSYLEVGSRLEVRALTYSDLDDAKRVFVYRQTAALLKKYPFVNSDLPTSPQEVALSKWRLSEEKCKDTNDRIKSKDFLPKWALRAKCIMHEVLGDLTNSKIMRMISSCKHGPGSTASNKGNRVSEYYKYLDTPYTVTSQAKIYAYAAISQDPKWIDYLESTGRRKELPPAGSPRYQKELMILKDVVDQANSDKVIFVPKDCRTDRPISVGSSLNVFLQLGVKAYIEEELRTVGIDLLDQTKNQELALRGSKVDMSNPIAVQNQFSTIDLASASDTLSIGIVEFLLDPLWFAFLDDLRHKTSLIGDETVTCNKFAAMGNGFTFPLETLVFYCICKAATEDAGYPFTKNDFAIYGDDIIVRNRTAPHVISALNWAGFDVNSEKSFLSGNFKESCGEDYFHGQNVRPFYLKRRVVTYEDVYFAANSVNIKHISASYQTNLNTMYTLLASKIPKRERNFGPFPSKGREDDGLRQSLLSQPSDSFFAVSLSFMNSKGLRPFLSENETYSLLKSNLIDKAAVGLQSLYAVYTLKRAKLFKARPFLKYMIRLRSYSFIDHFDPWIKRMFDLEDTSNTNVTSRRNSVESITKVLPVLNWNGSIPNHVLRHRSFEYLLSFEDNISPL